MTSAPSGPGPDGRSQTAHGETEAMDPYATVGQFSFAPATKTTVVTTTYTTTTTYPPMCINAPGSLGGRDPKDYPLAHMQAPESIRKIYFDAGGELACFEEANATADKLHEHKSLHDGLRAANGTLQKVQSYHGPPVFATPNRATRPNMSTHHQSLPSGSSRRKRENADDTTPLPSIREAAELASFQRRSKKPRISMLGDRGGDVAHASSHYTPEDLENSVPTTPDTDMGGLESSKVLRAKSGLRTSTNTAGYPSQATGQPQPSARWHLHESFAGPSNAENSSFESQERSCGRSFSTTVGHLDGPGVVATPPIAESDMEPVGSFDSSYSSTQLTPLDISSAQDASLPSPSLSPITAAANMAQQNAAGASFSDTEGNDGLNNGTGLDMDDFTLFPPALGPVETSNANGAISPNPQLMTPGTMDIPGMLNTFDALPEQMKSYVMYQLLRRCKKPTLNFVADVVNPALKCDFLTLLPTELSLQIISYLDAKSMCSAAQVSKRWRTLTNSHETAWKALLEEDGYKLPKGEVERAVKEGWGWQFPESSDSYERDLRALFVASRSDNEAHPGSPGSSISGSTLDHEGAVTRSSSTRQKRKATSKHGSSKKLRKKGSSSAKSQLAFYSRSTASARGATAYAKRAEEAIPDPNVGLSSLGGMHFFKSLYQRHHLIRKSWMAEDTKPKHIAFRAHQRHVVTCLQFDTDKILTGSDDTNINVYDTKTGVLRSRLEGHEGGVWALQYDGNTLVSGSTDRSVRVWDIEKGKCVQTFQGHTSTVRCLVILKPTQIGETLDGQAIMMPKEDLIITGSRDSTLRVWKLPQPGERSIMQTGPAANDHDNPYFIRALTGHHHSVRAIAARGDTLVSGSYDCTVRVWKISTGEVMQRLQGHSQKVYSVVLDHGRNRCISGSMDNMVKVWSLESGACIFTLEGHTSLVGLLDLSHERLVSAAADSTLRIWDPENGQCKSRLCAHTGAITCFQHDGQKVISGSDKTLKMWNVKTGEFVKDLLTDLSGVWQVKFNERRCVAAVQRNSMTYIEVLDFGASRDGVPADQRGRRIVVDSRGHEIEDVTEEAMEVEQG
ncbi:WD40 repeat-like protein [Dothidotthia symphoricarpi CBS 119687]|uniref:WD40 repeat-like protein n=1 Tax=Dothidotthia symphoricarpi CBS 119687 TaxID=1392245 RepID=A0A6A6AGS1_9PLEO|nr:WD40 repeat-like protein [Dothidotthia symphoricarpi CBS 119687]KAF2130248.1 WD40 repeat-like protein [Dothidotthia symphoricarpi CBS 119687]